MLMVAMLPHRGQDFAIRGEGDARDAIMVTHPHCSKAGHCARRQGIAVEINARFLFPFGITSGRSRHVLRARRLRRGTCLPRQEPGHEERQRSSADHSSTLAALLSLSVHHASILR